MESFPESDNEIRMGLVNDKCLQLDSEKNMQFVVLSDEIVVGYALVTRFFDPIIRRCNYLIDYVCIDSRYRGLGLGKKLMAKIEESAISENVNYMQLSSSRFRTSARRMYLSMGYEIRESDIFRKVI